MPDMPQPSVPLIPTETKAKLPRDLSFPLRAQAISDALRGVPQFDELILGFYHRKYTPHPQTDDMPRPVLVASFHRYDLGISASHAMEEAGLYDKKWGITVYPVLKSCRHCVNSLLTQHALPRMRGWLLRPGAAAWAHGRKRLTFLYQPNLNQISVSEAGEALAES